MNSAFIARIVLAIFIFLGANAIAAELDSGHRILIERGLQLQAVAYPPDSNPGFVQGINDVNRWINSNFTTINSWWWPMPGTLSQLPAGQQWGRAWYGSSDPNFPGDLTAAEMNYIDGFTSMMYLDEPSDAILTTPYWLDSMRDAYAYWQAEYDVLTYTDFHPFTTESVAANYIQHTQPNIVVFNGYPDYTVSKSVWYTLMQRYRNLALAGHDGTGQRPIPYGQFLNLSRTSNSYSAPIPDESYFRLNQFAGWAFGFTWASGWMYTSSAGDISSLFSSNGDSSPTPAFGYVSETNRQSRNIGPALVRMLSTDVRMLPGRSGGSFNALPDGISAWSQGTADTAGYLDHLFSIQPTVSQGGGNDTTYNDIVIGYFQPLLDDNSAATFADGLHFMIVNGASTGTASASAQWYRLTFDFAGSDFDSLVRLSRNTGEVELVNLTHSGGTMYYLDLNLPGGTGDLFGFWDSSNPLPTIPEPGTLSTIMIGLCAPLMRRRGCA